MLAVGALCGSGAPMTRHRKGANRQRCPRCLRRLYRKGASLTLDLDGRLVCGKCTPQERRSTAVTEADP
jgi:ribosomal protein S27AE